MKELTFAAPDNKPRTRNYKAEHAARRERWGKGVFSHHSQRILYPSCIKCEGSNFGDVIGWITGECAECRKLVL